MNGCDPLLEHICPECRDGKCRNCDGGAWCNTLDQPATCVCKKEH